MSAPRESHVGPLLALLLALAAGVLAMVHPAAPDYQALVALRAWIARYVRPRCGVWLDAEDITSEVLLRAVVSWEAFRPGEDAPTNLRRWLSGIARNTVAEQKRNDRNRQANEHAFTLLRGGVGGNLARHFEARSLLSVLRDSTAAENWRAVLLQGMGFAAWESGEREGVPKSTIEWRLSEARRDFANVLAKLESEGER